MNAQSRLRQIKQEGHTRKFLAIVDETPECETAIYFAAARAASTGSELVLLFAVEQEDFQHWLAVEEIAREEGEHKAKAVFRLYARKIKAWGFDKLVVHEVLRHGDRPKQLLELIHEDRDIAFLVLAASSSAEGPGRLITWLISKQAGSFPIPIVIIPEAMSFEEIDALV